MDRVPTPRRTLLRRPRGSRRSHNLVVGEAGPVEQRLQTLRRSLGSGGDPADSLDDFGLALDWPDEHLGCGSGQHDEPRRGRVAPDLDEERYRFSDVLDDLGREDEVERADVAHFVEETCPDVDTELGASALGGTRRIDANRLPPKRCFARCTPKP